MRHAVHIPDRLPTNHVVVTFADESEPFVLDFEDEAVVGVRHEDHAILIDFEGKDQPSLVHTFGAQIASVSSTVETVKLD